MTHRLLGHPRWSQHNFKRATGGGGCSQAAAHNYAATSARPFSSWLLCCGNQLSLADAQQRRRQTPLMPSTVFATFRPQSTTPDAAPAAAAERESLHKKRKRYRTKFAELIQMNNAGLLANGQASVKNLKHKELATFISSQVSGDAAAAAAESRVWPASGIHSKASSAAPIEHPPSIPPPLPSSPPALPQPAAKQPKPEYIRARKHGLIELGARFAAGASQHHKLELTEDEVPVLFVGRKLVRFERGSVEVQQIVDSYLAFKEFSAGDEAGDEVGHPHAAGLHDDHDVHDVDDCLAHNLRSSGGGGSRRSMDGGLSSKSNAFALDDHLYFDGLDTLPARSTATSRRERSASAPPAAIASKPASTPAAASHQPGKANHKSLEHEQLARHKALLQNLTVYLGVCVHNAGMLQRGLSTLLAYRARCRKSDDRLNIADVRLWNILLGGYAREANVGKVREILAAMREDAVAPVAGTWAAVFECVGRMAEQAPEGDMQARRMLREYESEAKRQDITPNDIMCQSKFIGDQRERVLAAIRLNHPHFQPVYPPPPALYDNDLLRALNEHQLPLEQRFDAAAAADAAPVAGSEVMAAKNGFRPADLVARAEEQLRCELDAVIAVRSVERFPEPSEQVLLYRQRLADLHARWRQQIAAAFQRDLNTLRSHQHSKGNRSIGLHPYLRALAPDAYAAILMQEARLLSEGSETYSATVGALYKRIGQKVQSRYYMERKRSDGVLAKTRAIYADYVHALSGRYSADNPRQSWQRHVHQAQSLVGGPSMDLVDEVWPNTVLLGVGRFLFQILMRDVKIDANVLRANARAENVLPAFYTLFRNEGKYVKEEVKPHPVLAKLYRGSQQEILHFDSNTVPMLCPPQPWSTPQNGGYLLARSDLIRLPTQAHQQLERIARTDPVHMYPSLDSLNQLSAVAWRVNTAVLDIILDVFARGGSKQLDVPQPPSALAPLEEVEEAEVGENGAAKAPSKADLYNRFRLKLLHRRKQSEMYSLWCDALYRLSLANHFRDKIFWLPHNMDFRGRVYPIPPHLNHLGSDLARCLLVFHQRRPLGPAGFDWLKLHCINLTGFQKKQPVAERLAFAEQCMPDILDSADRPLDGRMWWAGSDEPWQTLATCLEIARVLRDGRPPAEVESSFPIHQDGSCNGLQHYAALGRDTAGAVSVNLAPCERPQDVYSDVAALVEEARRVDAANGSEVAQRLDGYIRRAVIKQTVMTTVYGVTRFGARTQIARQLKDIEAFPKDWVWPASTYLTTKTFESLREMFTSTREIQDWFTHCARLISGVGGQNVAWTTPLGLPIVQPYNRFEFGSNPKSTRLQAEQMHFDTHLKPNVMKQKNAFPPNFIHSLDSSHMMLTSLHCERRGLTFMSVHDCYWTHACSVAEMNRVCREQFVALHSQPILEELSMDMAERYGYKEREFTNDGSVQDSTRHKLNRALLQLPGKGDFDLRNVLDSVYFFS